MSRETYNIALPPEGLLLREFAVTALAYVAYYAGDAMRLSLGLKNAEITFSSYSTMEIAKAFQRFFQEAVKRVESQRECRPSLVGNDWRQTIPKWIKLISDKTGVKPSSNRGWDLVREGMEIYSNWIGREAENLREALDSLSVYESGGDLLIGWGRGAGSRSPEALTLFKANYYAGRRGMGSKWKSGLEAKVKLDEHTLSLSLAGAIMAKQGVFKPRQQNIAIYLSLLDPGAMGLKDELSSFIVRVGYRLSPDVVFRLASAMAAYGGGASFGRQPLKLITVSEGGNRANIVSVTEFEFDYTLLQFLERLSSRSSWAYSRLLSLVEYTLSQWESMSRESRTIVELGYMLAHAIVLSCSGSLSPEEALYNLSRVSYASASREFEEALKVVDKALRIGDLRRFASLVRSVYLSLREVAPAVP